MKKTFLLALITPLIFLNSYNKKNDAVTIKNEAGKTCSNQIEKTSNGNAVIDGQEFPSHYLALTYDDGPDVSTQSLIDYLHNQKVLATFFVCRDWSQFGYPGGGPYGQPLTGGYFNTNNATGGNVITDGTTSPPSSSPRPDLTAFTPPNLQYYITNGQLLGNHTLAHGIGPQNLSDVQQIQMNVLNAIEPVQDDLDPIITSKCYLFRAPYFNWPAGLDGILNGSTINVKKLKGNYIDANLDVQDYASPRPNHWPFQWGPITNTADLKASDLVNLVTAKAKGIILLHDRNELAVGSSFAYDITKIAIPALKNQGYVFGAPVLKFSPEQIFSTGSDFSDADGWGSDIGYYGTLRLVDVTGDGKADMCGRGKYGISVAKANGNGFGAKTLWKWNDFTDAAGYKPAQYSTTTQFGDVDGDGLADVIIRGPKGIMVARNTGASSFGPASNWSATNSGGVIRDFSNADGWGNPIYYGSIRLVDINQDGKADICGRGKYGISVALSTGSGFSQKTLWKWDDFTDALGWGNVKYSSTLQFADVTGDNLPDAVIRGPNGMFVAKNTGSTFGPALNWSANCSGVYDFSDAEGWGTNVSYYGTIRLADINGDGIADVCGRSAAGIVVAFGSPNFNTTGGFLCKTIWSLGGSLYTDTNGWIDGTYYSDANGWNDPKYSSTIQFGDINIGDGAGGPGDKRADLVARFFNGLKGGFAP